MHCRDDRAHHRVLVIDDNDAIHRDFRKILVRDPQAAALADDEAALFGQPMACDRLPDYLVDSAYQGEEGLEMVAAAQREGRPYALAFVDMRMPPGWDGLTTISEIFEVDGDIQIVICTAFSDHTWHDIVQALGMSDRLLILKKPFDTIEVRQLACALTTKWNLARKAKLKMTELERMVQQRTVALETEMVHREKVAEVLRKQDRELQRRRRLEAVGALAGGIAHEFNNLLQTIHGYTIFVRDGVEPGGQPYEELTHVLQSVDHAAGLTQQLLDFSRRQLLERRAVALAPLIAGISRQIEPLLGDGTCLQLEAIDTETTIDADPNLVEEAIVNLCRNAIDAMPSGGRLTIAVESIDLGPDERESLPSLCPGPHVCIAVADTGRGIPPTEHERIFDPFYTTKAVGEGTGLGLAVVQSVVEQHQGAVTVESEPGRGATFKLYFPVTCSDVSRSNAPIALPQLALGTNDGEDNEPRLIDDVLVGTAMP